MGGCSDVLRQEFRELELLDKITRLQYSGKLPVFVDGDTRNNIITSFREWKGEQYVPCCPQLHQVVEVQSLA